MTFFEHYGSDKSKYQAEIEKHLFSEEGCFRKTMKTRFPQTIQLIEGDLLRFLQ
jgi:hypothetical protein